MLELRQLIEHACLPDRCEISCTDGANLTIRLGQGQSLDECCTLSGVPLRSLNTCRDLRNLVEQLRTLRDSRPVLLKSIA